MSTFRRSLMMQNNIPYKKKLEYIEGTGTQYLNTGYICSMSSNYKSEYDIAFNADSTQRWTGANAYLQTSIVLSGTSCVIGGIETINIDNNSRINLTVEFKNSTEYQTVNDKILSKTWSDFNDQNIKILGLGFGKTGLLANTYVKAKLYGYKLYKDDILVLDLIPVLDKSNVACMYDKVTKSLIYNNGTGNFTY